MKTSFCKQIYLNNGVITIPVGEGITAPVVELLQRAAEKHGGYLSVTLELPKRPRSTGQHSQNHRINGFIQQICAETGNDFDDVKMYCKRKALRRGYPVKTDAKGNPLYSIQTGEVIPESESKIDVQAAGLLIEEIEQLAAELGIMLEE